jgi:hypothetical protein
LAPVAAPTVSAEAGAANAVIAAMQPSVASFLIMIVP